MHPTRSRLSLRLLLDALELPQGVRLVGVSVSGLDRADRGVASQLSFASFGDPSEPGDSVAEEEDQAWLHVQEALSAMRARYGQGSVGPAALVGPGRSRGQRKGRHSLGSRGRPGTV